jgi:hypothetical protein
MNNIYVDRYNYKNVKDLLNEILNRTIGYNRANGTIPECVKMTAKQYYAIRKYKSDLIKYKDGNYYILCMRVVL